MLRFSVFCNMFKQQPWVLLEDSLAVEFLKDTRDLLRLLILYLCNLLHSAYNKKTEKKRIATILLFFLRPRNLLNL